MDDPSNNYKLPPIIIRSPRSYSTSPDKEGKYQTTKVPITNLDKNTNDNIIEQENMFQPSRIKKDENIPIKNDENWSPTVLVIGPGGMKGFLELGALAKLEEQHVLDNVITYFGVSVGSIICLLRVIGYTYQQIAELGSGLNLFNGWDDINFTKILYQNGVIPHEKLRDFLSEIVRAKMGFIPTFQELYKKTGYILKVVSYNITTQTTYYFDYRTHPDTSAIEIVLASSSIPLLFYKFKHKGDYYCDGAIGNPYPIDIADDGTTDILGIYISSTPDTNNQENLHWYLDRIIHATMSEYRKHIIKNSSPRCKHLVLYSDIKDVTGMAVDNELRVNMFNSGYTAASNFLNREDDMIVVDSKSSNPIPYVPSERFSEIQSGDEISLSNIFGLSSRGRSGLNGLYVQRELSNYNRNMSVSLNNIPINNKTKSKKFRKSVPKNRRSSHRSKPRINNYQTETRETGSGKFNSDAIREIENRVMKKLVPLIISRTIKSQHREHLEGSDNSKSYLDCLISPINIIPPAGKIIPRKIYQLQL